MSTDFSRAVWRLLSSCKRTPEGAAGRALRMEQAEAEIASLEAKMRPLRVASGRACHAQQELFRREREVRDELHQALSLGKSVADLTALGVHLSGVERAAAEATPVTTLLRDLHTQLRVKQNALKDQQAVDRAALRRAVIKAAKTT